MSNPLRILEDQAKKNEAKVSNDEWVSYGSIYGKAYTNHVHQGKHGILTRRGAKAQSRLNIGSLSIKFFKKRPGPIRRAFIKWLLGWTWDELTQEKEKADPFSTPGYYYQGNSGSVTFGNKGYVCNRDIDMDMLNAIPTIITTVPSLRTNDPISGSPR